MYETAFSAALLLARLWLRLAIKGLAIVQTLTPKIVKHYVTDYYHRSGLSAWLRWRPTSAQQLEAAERKVLSYVRSPFRSYYVDIGQGWGHEHNKIWTLEMTPEEQHPEHKTPIVLVHGFASAAALWSLNLDALVATNRKVYAFDVLGFGRSSRPALHETSDNCEADLVSSIERWRSKLGLNDKFILLGHSFGAYLSASYALQHPQRVAHLILADPWGMPTQDMNRQLSQHLTARPWWVNLIAKVVVHFTPLAGLRLSGPWGPKLVQRLRSDIRKKYEVVYGEGNADCVLEYVYHCNAQPNPTGEQAFKQLSTGFGWARYPMIERIGDLHKDVDLTFIYGSRSWIDRQPGFQTKYLLGDRVSVHVIQGSGHHVYADKHEEFNGLVAKVCDITDLKRAINAVNDDSDAEDVAEPPVAQPLVD